MYRSILGHPSLYIDDSLHTMKHGQTPGHFWARTYQSKETIWNKQFSTTRISPTDNSSSSETIWDNHFDSTKKSYRQLPL